MIRGLWVALALGLALVTACSSDDDDSQGTGGAAGSGADTVESLAAIQADIFNVSCSFSTCHSPDGNRGNLVLGKSDVESSTMVHGALVGVTADIDKTLVRVRPGDPANSLLVMKLRAATMGFKVTNCDEKTTVCGDPMPQNALSLEDAQIERIERWVKQGALDN